MFTDLEVIQLKARQRHSRPGLLTIVAVLAALGASSAAAQTKTGDRVMIPTLQSADQGLGGQAAEAIRSQLQRQTNLRDLVVVPKADIENSLRSSGYSPTEALAPGDAKALATLVRAPQYLEGTATKTPTGYKIDSRLIISRDMTRGQVLPSDPGCAPPARWGRDLSQCGCAGPVPGGSGRRALSDGWFQECEHRRGLPRRRLRRTQDG
jgi:hypothetical protein